MTADKGLEALKSVAGLRDDPVRETVDSAGLGSITETELRMKSKMRPRDDGEARGERKRWDSDRLKEGDVVIWMELPKGRLIWLSGKIE